jgi:hypothetical protein
VKGSQQQQAYPRKRSARTASDKTTKNLGGRMAIALCGEPLSWCTCRSAEAADGAVSTPRKGPYPHKRSTCSTHSEPIRITAGSKTADFPSKPGNAILCTKYVTPCSPRRLLSGRSAGMYYVKWKVTCAPWPTVNYRCTVWHVGRAGITVSGASSVQPRGVSGSDADGRTT